ncbi:protein FAM24A [Physeter macrocephalus]|uniref:Protein FAM24A n=1 Tax=Physeter macrocephalus TaxID=9755 RepID=A0A455AMG9_PHYMC|nr:protein FAM24B [Physeter catodon]|eukprot:XP_028337772.1 protein FAM24B [Physeter catodon]
MFDLKIMIAIGGGLLMTAFVLIGVVICLYFQVADTLNAAKAPVAMAITKSNRDTVAEATTSTSESYPSLQCLETKAFLRGPGKKCGTDIPYPPTHRKNSGKVKRREETPVHMSYQPPRIFLAGIHLG